jgi:hypothetical protein
LFHVNLEILNKLTVLVRRSHDGFEFILENLLIAFKNKNVAASHKNKQGVHMRNVF